MNDNNNIREIYDALSRKSPGEIMPYEEFESMLTSDESKRRDVYNALDNGSMIPFEDFDRSIMGGTRQPSGEQPQTSQSYATPSTQPTVQSAVPDTEEARIDSLAKSLRDKKTQRYTPSSAEEAEAVAKRVQELSAEEQNKKQERQQWLEDNSDRLAAARDEMKKARRAKWEAFGKTLMDVAERTQQLSPMMANPMTSDIPKGGKSQMEQAYGQSADEVIKEYADNKLVADALDEALDYAHAVEREGSVGQGFVDVATRPGTWDFGYSDVVKGLTLHELAEKAESGEPLSEQEEKTLDMVALATYITASVQDGVSTGYNVGGSLPQSLGFMASLAVNPTSGLGRSMMMRAAKKYGEKGLKTLASRAIGDVAEMATATVTSGAGRTLADAIDRVNGSTQYEISPEGYVTYGGQAEQENLGKAAAKAFGNQFIENYTEALGEYFTPLAGMLGNLTDRSLRKVGFGKMADFINRIPQSQWGKMVEKFKDITKFNGIIGEILEEEIGMVMEPVFIGDSTLGDNFAIWSKDAEVRERARENQLTTILSCALMSGALYGVEAGGSRLKFDRDLRNADRRGSVELGDEWAGIRERLDNSDPDELVRTLKDIVYNPGLSNSKRAAIVGYAAKLIQTQEFNTASELAREEMDSVSKSLMAAYDAGYRMGVEAEPRNFRNVNHAAAQAEIKVKEMGLADVAHQIEEADAATRNSILSGLNVEEHKAVMDYLGARERQRGLYEGVDTNMYAEWDEARWELAPAIVENSDGTRTITSAMTADGRFVYVVGTEGAMSVIVDEEGNKVPYPTDQLEDIQVSDADVVIEELRKASEDSWRSALNFYSAHNPQTQEPQIGMVIGDGDETVIITDMGEGWATIQDATTDSDGNVIPKSDGKSRDVTKEYLLSLQDDIYDNRDRMDGYMTPDTLPEEESQQPEQDIQAMRDRAEQWSSATGVSVRFVESVEDIANSQAKEAISQGVGVTGWYDVATGEVYFYMPNIADLSEIDKTFIHEVVGHKGMRLLLGEQRYDELCDRVWNELMDEVAQREYLEKVRHLSGDEAFMRRAAADEFIAYFAEKIQMNPTEETQTLWQSFVQMVQEILSRMGLGETLTTDDLSSLLQASLARYRKEMAKERQEDEAPQAQPQQSEDQLILASIPPITDGEGNTVDYAWEQAPDIRTAIEGMNVAGYTEDDIRTFADAQVEELKKKSKALEKKTPKSLPEQKKKREELEANTRSITFWQSVIDALNEEAEIDRQKETLDAINGKYTEVVEALDKIADELDFKTRVRYEAAKAKYIWNDSNYGTKGLLSHIISSSGNKNSERNSRLGWIAGRSKGGLYPEVVAERIYANLPDGLKEGHDTMEILDIIIDTVLSANHPATAIRNIYRDVIQSQQEAEFERERAELEEEERQKERYTAYMGFASFEDLTTFEELQLTGEDIVVMSEEERRDYEEFIAQEYEREQNQGVLPGTPGGVLEGQPGQEGIGEQDEGDILGDVGQEADAQGRSGLDQDEAVLDETGGDEAAGSIQAGAELLPDGAGIQAATSGENVGNTIQGLEGYTEEQLKDIILEHVGKVLGEMPDNFLVSDIRIIGSRANGTAREGSDLDVLLEYEGDITEDALFNALNGDNRLEIDGIKVDINPITPGKSGTIQEFLERNKDYKKETKEDELTDAQVKALAFVTGKSEEEIRAQQGSLPYDAKGEKTLYHPATLRAAYESGNAADIARAEKAVGDYIMSSDSMERLDYTAREFAARKKNAEKGSAEYRMDDFCEKKCRERIKEIKRKNQEEQARLDKEYVEAVKSGDIDKALDMLREKALTTEGITGFVAPNAYRGSHRDVAKLIKTGKSDAVQKAAADMARFVPGNAVLVPIPSHEGKVTDETDTKILADAVAEITGSPVIIALEGNPRESRYQAKQQGKEGLKADELGFRQIAEIPEGKVPVFIDNVVDSGETAKAASEAIKGGFTMAYAKGVRSNPTRGLKNMTVTYDDNGNLIPLSQRFDAGNTDTRFRITPEQDAEYKKAYEGGDTEKATQMVKDAFKEAYPYTKVVDEKGEPMVVYHGTPWGGFNAFDASTGDGGFNWVTPEKGYADNYAGSRDEFYSPTPEQAKEEGKEYNEHWNPEIKQLFVNLANPYYLGDVNVPGTEMDSDIKDIASGLGITVEEFNEAIPATKWASNLYEVTNSREFAKLIADKGFDGVITREYNKYRGYGVYNPNAIKSAEPFTFDNNGNLIPLNERFNTANNDVRFRQSNDRASLMGAHNISEEKLKKVLNVGGLANPSMAIVDTDKYIHQGYGDISLIPYSSTLDASKRRGVITYNGDAWSPTYPGTKRILTSKGENKLRRLARKLAGKNEELYNNILNDFWAYADDNYTRLAVPYLLSKGEKVEIQKEKPTHSREYAKEVAKALGVDEIGTDVVNLRELTPEQNKALFDLLIKKHTEEVEDKAKDIKDKERADAFRKLLNDTYREKLADEEGNLYFNVWNSLLYSLWRSEMRHKNARTDWNATRDMALRQIEDKDDYWKWIGNLLTDEEWPEKLYAGTDSEGRPRYIPNTLENASRLMKRDKDLNSYDQNGYSATKSLLLRKMRTLSDIRRMKDQLTSAEGEKEEKDEMFDEWFDVVKQLSNMQKISDNQYSNNDYAEYRLQEAILKSNPVKYLNEEYGYDIDENSEFAKQLKGAIERMKNSPVKYFETKFNRPVYLNEFKHAIVPDNIDPEVRSGLAQAGLKVTEYESGNNEDYENKVREATEGDNDVRFRVANADQEIFVSNAERAVESIKQDKATPQQWLAMIQKQGGIKAGEDKWLRLSQWLQEQKSKTMTKGEILEFIDKNKIKIEEQLYSENPSDARDLEEYYPGWFEAFYEDSYEGPGGESIEWKIRDLEKAVELYNVNNSLAVQIDIDENGDITDDEFDEILDWAKEAYRDTPMTERGINPIHLSYTTEGLENKREIALTVPAVESWNIEDPIHFGDAGGGKAIAWIRFGEISGETERQQNYSESKVILENELRRANERLEQGLTGKRREDQEQLINEIQDRLNTLERNHSDISASIPKILVIDEIQSKRHQEGRERGYKSQFNQSELDKAREEAHNYSNELYKKYGKPGEDFLEKATKEEKARFEELNSKVSAITRLRASGIPDAPFEKNWSELAMKRMLRLAAEEGYDRIAWTTGDQQSERYNIGGYLSSIKRRESNDINEMEFALNLNGANSQYITTDKNGNVVYSLVTEFRDRNLADIIGKELAEKALALKENEEMDTDDITISNSGMATFYDKMLVNFMNKYGKQWGVKVENVDIPGISESNWENAGDGLTMHSVEVTPEMRRDVLEGQVMFRVANEKNKQVSTPEPELDEVMFRVSNRDRETISKWLNKRTDLTEPERQKVLDYIDTLDDKKIQLATGWWFAKGSIRIPEDMPKVEQAVQVAGIAKVDPMQYSSPMELINAHANIQIKEKPIDPNTVNTLHKAKELPDGIVVYDVDDTEESRENMRRIIDTHFGKESSPWCLLQGDGEGGLTRQSKEYWDYYNSYPKQVAFKNGKLLAFSANRGPVRWWDRMDEPHVGIPVEGKIPNDELGRSGVMEYDPVDGEATIVGDMWRGNTENGPFETYYDTGQLKRRSTRKDTFDVGPVEVWHKNGQKSAEFTNNELGNTEGEFKTWYPNGQLHTTGTTVNGRLVGVHETYFDNGQLEMRTVYPDTWKGNEHPIEPRERFYPNGQIRSIEPYDENGIKNGTETEWFEDGQKEYEVEYVNNEPVRSTHWFQNGDLESKKQWDEDGHKTGVWEKYRWDWDKKKSVPQERTTYRNGAKNGIYEEYYPNGQMKMQTNFKDSTAEGLTETWNEDGKPFLRFVRKDRKEIGHEYYNYDNNEVVQMYTMRNGTGEPHNYVRRLPMEGYTPLTEEELSTYPGWAREEILADPTMFRVVKDKKELDKLNNDPKGYIDAYASMAKIDGKYYPPMAAQIKDEAGKTVKAEPMEIGDWTEAEERTKDDPNIRVGEDGKWEYHLIKPDGKDLWVAYNPYAHSTLSPLNDQFTAAHARPELVMVKVRIPKSDLDGYQAEGAKDAVGETPWHSGPVSAKLKGTEDERKVILSRYRQLVEEVPVEEEAKAIADVLSRHDNIAMPINVVRPQLREALRELGVKFGPIKGSVSKEDRKELNKILSDIRFRENKNAQDELKGVDIYSDEFKSWFGDWQNDPEHSSKVVDENGKPLVVYHGTDLNQTNQGESFYVFYGDSHFGTWEQARDRVFSPYNKEAKYKIYNVYLNIRNPKRVQDMPGDWKETSSEYWEPIIKKAKEEGYDGIVYENLWEGSETADSYIAFEPNQIKLAEPLSFDSEGKLIPASRRYRKYNDDIRFREGENTLFSQEEMQGNVNSSRNNGIFASNTQNNERRESDIWREGNRDRTEDTGRRTDAVSAAQPEEIVKPLRKLEEGETCHVERKLTKTGDFNFVGKDRIESLDDVAYIFRQLENKSVENTFMVFVKDGKATVLHVGIGLVSSSPADMSGLTVMMRNIKPDKVYMVHNHPSGQLISSNNDRALWAGLRKILGDKLEPGIIINTTSGKYGVYEGDAISSEKRDFKDIKGDIRIPVYRFDENVFSKDYDPSGTPLRTSRDVAEFVSSHRLGERDKLSVLCLDHSQKVRGNFFLPYTGFRRAEEIDKIAADCAYYTAMSGADAVVIYGNGAVPGIGTLDALAVRKIKEFLYINNMSLVEIVGDYRDDTGDYYSWFDHGKMTEPDAYYGKRQELKQAEADTDTNPTEGQKEAGNYRKGHIRLFGMELSIENPQGSERSGVDQDGNEWSQKMNNTYGYIRGTAGRDKDHIDFFLGPDLMSDKVFVVDQRNVKTGVFDEHKVMLGFDDIDQARAAYNSNYEEGWLGLGAITESDMDDFKEWAFREGRRVKPFSETNGDGAVLFRTREPQEYQRIETSLGVAAARYEKAMDQMGVRLNEVMQDSMRSVRELQDAISQADGKPIHDFENAYWAAIQYSSRNKAMQEAYHKLFYRPLMKEVARLTSGVRDKEAAMDELNAYLMAKHGLERNEVFARRDAKRQYEEHMSKHPNSNMTEDDFYNRCRRKDYSGLTALTMEDHVADAEQKARIIVDNYESNHDVKELWRRINAATKETLRTSLQGGLLSQEKYAELATMFENYVPLRGFDETTSDDIYGYYGTVNSPYNTAIKKAYGRRSLADSPLATIGNIADSEIMRANRNRIYLAALSLAENHHNGLLSVSEVMFMRNPQTGQWEIALPPLDVNDTPEEVAQKMSAFRNWFAQQLMTDPMNYRTSSEMANVPYKVISKNALSEHQIMATRGGKQYIITVNGNPRAAQALAGKTNPDSSPALQWLAPFNRFLAQVFTQYNPSFVLANLTRDGIYTNAMVWAKESPAYARKYNANWTKSLASMGPLLVKYKKGTLDDNVPIERYFKEFIDNGGETGYTQLRSVKDYKKLMQKELKDVTSLSPAAAGRKVMGAIGDAVENMNRWAEGVSRFAAYMTSREQGRSVVRSVEDAKEISVNFNKKGSGVAAMTDKDREERMLMNVARASQLGRELFVFFNAGVQGMANAGGVVKNNPGKATALMAGLFLAGAALAMMNGGDGDGDDEKEYYNLPEYIRRSNICLKAGKHWITIPLPIELRALYGLGELAYSVMSGNEYYEPEELSYEVASQLSQILPIDFLEGNQGTMAFMPSGIKPLAENRLNQDWTGAPIYNKTPYNEDDPAWRKAFSSTNPTLVTMSRKLSEATGGNVGKRGWIDVNPAKVEHLFEGYLGGVGTTLNQAYKTARALTGDTDMREIRNVPVVSRFVRDADDRAAVRAENSRYYKVKKYVDEVMNEDRRLRQVIAEKTITGYDYDDDAIKDAERRHRELQDSDEWRFVQQWRNLDKGRTNAREGHDEDEFNALTKKMNDLYKDFRKRQRDE